MDGSKLEKVYSKIKSGKATPAAVHNAGVGTNGKCPPPASLARPPVAKQTMLHRPPHPSTLSLHLPVSADQQAILIVAPAQDLSYHTFEVMRGLRESLSIVRRGFLGGVILSHKLSRSSW